MDPAEFTIFFQFETILHGSLVFCCHVIFLLAFGAGQRNIISHKKTAFADMEPTTRIELVTSSLPRMCSTN
jgi:hypothetical protein